MPPNCGLRMSNGGCGMRSRARQSGSTSSQFAPPNEAACGSFGLLTHFGGTAVQSSSLFPPTALDWHLTRNALATDLACFGPFVDEHQQTPWHRVLGGPLPTARGDPRIPTWRSDPGGRKMML